MLQRPRQYLSMTCTAIYLPLVSATAVRPAVASSSTSATQISLISKPGAYDVSVSRGRLIAASNAYPDPVGGDAGSTDVIVGDYGLHSSANFRGAVPTVRHLTVKDLDACD
jgi:hypothetical protein